ncbi:uncharacterized protein LOC116181440 [Photinus pyralis]|uniref:uncharacterized protein LOC116181440 n=1 Tax=Photinus pyralis TaxID=7054 RepID=UPI00126757A7|nr:uncharacterized protein LOC116181440 [Photinus pyralis]
MLFLATAVIFSSASFAQGYSFGYYWRDFNGTVSPDAFPGGMDAKNQPVYVALAYDKYLIAAQIFTNDNNAYYSYGALEHGVKINNKILCTEYPEQFEWIPTDANALKKITDKYLLKGGWEPNLTLYIGRAKYGNEVLVGKVLADSTIDGLYFTRNGKTLHTKTFDVLSFKSNQFKGILGVRSGR